VAVRQGGEALGQQTLGLVVPYSPEYAYIAHTTDSGTNRTLLEELARRTGGEALLEPVAAFLHNLPAADRAREAWRTLLSIVALLFPLDVAIRRVMLGPRDLQKALAWARERLPDRRRTRVDVQERALGQLFQARRRVRARTARTGSPSPALPPKGGREGWPVPFHSEPSPDQAVLQAAGDQGTNRPDDHSTKEDTFSRLRQAKQRARRGQ
jgi:hypothetical protein